ncbi:MAG TPA: peroxiredoxin-like family protein [Candidatus Heimdallarchaeota archaeon]|nr:peroxiredoxin-like family protein [Candidatus Heimdallarchaeota archaeon]
MRIQSGEQAKPFEVTYIFDRTISLEDYRGKRLMLSFYRYASCPLCNLRVAQLIARYPPLREQGLHLVAFFQSPRQSILETVAKQDVPFPIIPDPKRLIYKLYGVESSRLGLLKGLLRLSEFWVAMKKGFLSITSDGDRTLIPADFLVGPDLTIERAYYGADIGDHLTLEEIEAWLERPPATKG